MLALRVKLRQWPGTASERESVCVLCTTFEHKQAEPPRRRLESSGAVVKVRVNEP
jgi:hypothetical protein